MIKTNGHTAICPNCHASEQVSRRRAAGEEFLCGKCGQEFDQTMPLGGECDASECGCHAEVQCDTTTCNHPAHAAPCPCPCHAEVL